MKSILITGAGSGIGAAAAKRLARRRGVRLVLMGRRLAALQELKSSLPDAEQHVAVSMDVVDRESLVVWMDSEEADFVRHPLVAVFANAGIGGPNSFGKGDRWDEIVQVNLTGTYNTVLAAYPHLQRAPGRRQVLVTSSVLARFGVPGQAAYVASKTGLLGLVRSLATEWSSEGICVNALCPGWVDTEMARASIQALAESEGISFAESKARQEALLPTGAMSTPDEIAKWVDFVFRGLGEGEAEEPLLTLTGQALDVNSGSWMG